MGLKIEEVAEMSDKEGKKQVRMLELEEREEGVEEAITGTATSRVGARRSSHGLDVAFSGRDR